MTNKPITKTKDIWKILEEHRDGKTSVTKATEQINRGLIKARIDELDLIPLVNNKKVFVNVKKKDSLDTHLRHRKLELERQLN